ncbi:MAG: hypothetical protein KKG76_06960 [Euryarchaeota archaeon]|nr:hypothetical protein [Euryarchaeota archaeon]
MLTNIKKLMNFIYELCHHKKHIEFDEFDPNEGHLEKYSKTNAAWKIKKEIYFRFNEQIKWRKRKYGIRLSTLQKIKAARAISHEVYPTYKYNGKKGHWIRENFRKEILKSVNVEYIIK